MAGRPGPSVGILMSLNDIMDTFDKHDFEIYMQTLSVPSWLPSTCDSRLRGQRPGPAAPLQLQRHCPARCVHEPPGRPASGALQRRHMSACRPTEASHDPAWCSVLLSHAHVQYSAHTITRCSSSPQDVQRLGRWRCFWDSSHPDPLRDTCRGSNVLSDTAGSHCNISWLKCKYRSRGKRRGEHWCRVQTRVGVMVRVGPPHQWYGLQAWQRCRHRLPCRLGRGRRSGPRRAGGRCS